MQILDGFACAPDYGLAGTLLFGPIRVGPVIAAGPRSSGDRAPPSGGGSAGSNPAGGAKVSPSQRKLILKFWGAAQYTCNMRSLQYGGCLR